MCCVCNKTSFLGLASGKLLGDARILPDLVKYFACHMTMHVIGYVCKDSCLLRSDAVPVCPVSFPYRQTVIKFCYGADQDWLAKLSWRCCVALPHTRTVYGHTPAKDRKDRCAEFCWPLSLSFRKLCWRKKGRCHCFCRWLPGLVREGNSPRAKHLLLQSASFFAPARSAGRMPCGRAFRLDSAPSREAGAV